MPTQANFVRAYNTKRKLFDTKKWPLLPVGKLKNLRGASALVWLIIL